MLKQILILFSFVFMMNDNEQLSFPFETETTKSIDNQTKQTSKQILDAFMLSQDSESQYYTLDEYGNPKPVGPDYNGKKYTDEDMFLYGHTRGTNMGSNK